MKWTCCVLILLLPAVGFAQTGKGPVKVTDMLKIKSVGGLALSPDEKKVVFTLTSIEPDGDSKLDYKYVTQLWLATTDGTMPPRQLTAGKEGASQAAWSPDGKQ